MLYKLHIRYIFQKRGMEYLFAREIKKNVTQTDGFTLIGSDRVLVLSVYLKFNFQDKSTVS